MRALIVYAATGAVLLASSTAPAVANDGTGKGHNRLIALSSARPDLEGQQIGRVTVMDKAAMTFGCHWQSSDWTYQVAPKTVFRKGGAANFSDLKSGDTVEVLFHMDSDKRVADTVYISN